MKENPLVTPQPALNPWLSIWTQPRRTLRWILDTDPRMQVLLLGALSGVAQGLERASSSNLGDKLPLPFLLGICLLLGVPGGILSLYIGGALFRWTGSWIGGKAQAHQVRAALAWAALPQIAGLALWVPQLVLFGGEMFTDHAPRLAANPLAAFFFAVVSLILGVWSAVLYCKCLGEAHGFSAWKGLAALLLGTLMVAAPFGCLFSLAALLR